MEWCGNTILMQISESDDHTAPDTAPDTDNDNDTDTDTDNETE